jgi:hypothetical protein
VVAIAVLCAAVVTALFGVIDQAELGTIVGGVAGGFGLGANHETTARRNGNGKG